LMSRAQAARTAARKSCTRRRMRSACSASSEAEAITCVAALPVEAAA